MLNRLAAQILFGLCAAACLPAHAQAGSTFTIDFPKGWSTPAIDQATTEVRAPESQGNAWCRANSNPMPSLAGVAQAQLNSDYAYVWDAETWGDVLTVSKDKIQVFTGTGSSTLVDGHLVQKVTLVFAEDVFGAKVTGRFVSHVLPGRMVNAACFTRTETFDSFMTLFETTITSLKPA